MRRDSIRVGLLKRFVAVLNVGWMLSIPVAAHAANEAIQPGIYGNVRISRATGDLGGVEVEIHAGPGRILDVTVCEGWCDWIHQVAYEEVAGSIQFQILGRPYDPPRKFRLTRQGKDVRIEEDGEFVVQKAKLKRIKERFGLDVANFSMEESVREASVKTK